MLKYYYAADVSGQGTQNVSPLPALESLAKFSYVPWHRLILFVILISRFIIPPASHLGLGIFNTVGGAQLSCLCCNATYASDNPWVVGVNTPWQVRQLLRHLRRDGCI